MRIYSAGHSVKARSLDHALAFPALQIAADIRDFALCYANVRIPPPLGRDDVPMLEQQTRGFFSLRSTAT